MTTQKFALVTGGGSGIGRAVSLHLAQNSIQVLICGRNGSALAETVRMAGAVSSQIQPLNCDLSRPEEVDRLFDYIGSNWPALDYAVNNAGTEGKVSKIESCSLQDFDEVMNLNLRAMWYCLKKEIEVKTKSIVNVASVSGRLGTPELAIYCASKHGVVGLTRALAAEVASRGMRINCVCPGSVKTDMLTRVIQKSSVDFTKNQPMGRIASPEEIAKSIYWLLSDEATYITGESLVIDGGATFA